MSGPTDTKTPAAIRAAAIIDAFGTKSSRWPEDERAAVETLVANQALGYQEMNDAAALDLALDSLPSVPVPAALSQRILAGFDQVAQRPTVRRVINAIAGLIWPGAPLWQPSAALAASLALGIALGIMAPLGSSASATTTSS